MIGLGGKTTNCEIVLKKFNFPGCLLYIYVYIKNVIQLSIHSYW